MKNNDWIGISIGAFIGTLVVGMILPLRQIPGEAFVGIAMMIAIAAIVAMVLMKSSLSKKLESEIIQLPPEKRITEGDVLELTGAIPPVRAGHSVIKLLLCGFSSLKNYSLKSGGSAVGLRPSKTPVTNRNAIELSGYEKSIVEQQEKPLLLQSVLKVDPGKSSSGTLMHQYSEHCASMRSAHYRCYTLPAACALGLLVAKLLMAAEHQKDAGILGGLVMMLLIGTLCFAFGQTAGLDNKIRTAYINALRSQYKPIKLHPQMLLLHALADSSQEKRHNILLRMATNFHTSFSYMKEKSKDTELVKALAEEADSAESKYKQAHTSSDSGGCGCSSCGSGCGDGCGGGCGGCGDD